MKAIRQIWFLSMMVIFLIPAMGFNITTHYCGISQTSKIVFDRDFKCCCEDQLVAEGSCCEHGYQDDRQTEKSDISGDCTSVGEPEQCCSNEIRYIKEQDEYSVPGKVQVQQSGAILIVAMAMDYGIHSLPGKPMAQSNSPPILYTAKELLYQHSALLL
jgi:hypothetical protein